MTISMRILWLAAALMLAGTAAGQSRGATLGTQPRLKGRNRRLMNNDMGKQDDPVPAGGDEELSDIYDANALTATPTEAVTEAEVGTTETEAPTVEYEETDPPGTEAPVVADPPITEAPTEAEVVELNEERGITTDVIDSLLAFGNFKTFLSLLKWDGLTDILQEADDYTVLAPNDSAWPQGQGFDLFMSYLEDGQMATLLTYHIVPGSVSTLVDGTVLTSLEGKDIAVTVDNGVAYVDGREVQPGVQVANGVIYELNEFLVP